MKNQKYRPARIQRSVPGLWESMLDVVCGSFYCYLHKIKKEVVHD